MSSSLAHCLTVFWSAAKPRRVLSVSEWADTHRELTGKQSGERGRWRTRRTPFLREIMDCFSASSRVNDVVVMKSSQVGVTEVSVNVIGYIMDHAPAAMMVLMPTLEARDKWKGQKLNPLLTDTPVIRDLLGGQRSRDAANRQDMIDFPGGVLFLGGANSPNSYAQASVRIIILDDLDRFPPEVGSEGDPVKLAFGRTKAQPTRAKRFLISTPTVSDLSLIEREYKQTDQRRYHVPCPHCGEYQALEWGSPESAHGIKWKKHGDNVVDAWYVCAHCAGEIREHHKPAMLAAGRWMAAYPERKKRGYHITALLAPIGLGPSWLDLAIEWQDAIKSTAALKTFVNTNLGEVWVEPGEEIDPTALIARLEDYDELPRGLARTAGADVQKDRIECTIGDWHAGEECYVLAHLIVPGDTAQPQVWEDFAEELEHWAPEALAIDSNYNTSLVYAFVATRSWCFAIRGMDGPGRPVVEDAKARRQRLRTQRKKGVIAHLVGDDQSKALLTSRLRLVKPGPGYIHFPRDASFDDEYFAQLAAEKMVIKIRNGRNFVEWVKTRLRNEANDCFRYMHAALRLSDIDLDARDKARREKEANGDAPPAAPAIVHTPQRGIHRRS
jgi:phage terminase large subunit GpA-like protein